MKEIKLNPTLLIQRPISAVVDETTLEFKNGVAVAEAIIKCYGTDKTYKCFGLIDENFCEVYGDVIDGDITSQSLMFYRFNKNIVRCGDNDYIVEVSCTDYDRSWTEFRHISIENGVPIFVNKLGTPYFPKKRHSNLVTVGTIGGCYRIYDVLKRCYITPELSYIRPSVEDDRVFDVSLSMTADCDDLVLDHLYFKIDTQGNIVSDAISTLDNGRIIISESMSAFDFVEKRRAKLNTQKNDFYKRVRNLKPKKKLFLS